MMNPNGVLLVTLFLLDANPNPPLFTARSLLRITLICKIAHIGTIISKNSLSSVLPDLFCIFSSKFGIYEPNCGLDNVMMSWGHDEYLYRVLVNHGATIPEEGLAMIKYHSFYPWHTGGDYDYLTNEKDSKMMEWVREFK